MLVADIMDTAPPEIPLSATFRDAAELFVQTQTSDLIVMDDGQYVGVLAEGDLLRALLPDFEPITKSVAGVSLEEACDMFIDSGRFNADRVISALVLSKPMAVAPSDPLLKAATVMATGHIRRLPVIENGVLVGMLSRVKISWALLCDREPSASA